MSSSFSFAFLYLTRYEQQQVGLHWDNMWKSPIEDDETNFGIALIFIAADAVAYFLLGALIVAASQRKKRSVGRSFSVRQERDRTGLPHAVETPAVQDEDEFGILDNTTASIGSSTWKGKVGISFRGVTKIYESTSVKRRVAVDKLNMDFNVGDVTCLLGQN